MEQRDLMRDFVEVKGHEITLETLIENGWRIYDPQHKEVIDEFTFNDQITSSAKGISPVRALKSITDRKDSVLNRSRNTGTAYGSRLQPSKQIIYRDYYSNGSVNLVEADLLTRQEDYEAAAALWKKDMEHPQAKIRARACYNLAVLEEYRKELGKALEWAAMSYEYAKSKNTERYMEALKQRIAQQELLALQMAYNDILQP